MRDLENNVMKSVKMNKAELLDIVRANKEKHIKDFDEAVQDYIKLVVSIAEDNMVIADTKALEQYNKLKLFPVKPISYEDSYTRAIRMLELSIEKEIEIDATTFNQLVLDEWQWKQSFTTTVASYKTH